MGDSIAIWLIFLVIAGLILLPGIKIIEETERLAVFIGGRYARLKGPGIIFSPPNPWIKNEYRVSMGAVGMYMGSDVARFASLDLPIEPMPQLRLNDSVQISGFGEARIQVSKVDSISREFQCEKCGHLNKFAA